MPKQLYGSEHECCGCSACYAICPVGAITMKTNAEGFQYPYVDEARCVHCKKCETVCPLKKETADSEPLNIYAAKNINEAVRLKSSSGGMFSLLADSVESENGVIYGAAFDDAFAVRHVRAETTDEWKKLCVSKYVQSDMNDVFRQVYEDLQNERLVLFSGTPCQVAGLKTYLERTKTNTSKLITCDIVCHGVPSPMVWADYLEYLQKRDNRPIGYISFRDKNSGGWHNSMLTAKDKNGNVLLSEGHGRNYYSQLLFCGYSIRPSCHTCKYASIHRQGDITLGDFWGIERNFPDFDDDKGVSLAMINSQAGEKLWKQIVQFTQYFPVREEQCLQPNLQQPSTAADNRALFWRWYHKYGLKRAGQKLGYLPVNGPEKAVLFLFRCWDKLARVLRK